MSSLSDRIQHNLQEIQRRMTEAASRSSQAITDPTLIAVTKSVGLTEIRALYDLGLRHFGENRVEAALDKIPQLADTHIIWHMIAPLQRRKVRDAVTLFQRIDAVDRIQLAETIQRRCDEADCRVEVLLELNISGEQAKQGFSPETLPVMLEAMTTLDRLEVKGLMTMAPYGAEEAALRQIFRTLRELADTHNLPVRSMGMSNDFEVAIEEGATEVRIGRSLFS